MSVLNKASILHPPDLKREKVTIGPLKADVVMRELTVKERRDIIKRFAPADETDMEGMERAGMAMVAISLCNDDGSPMFPDDEVEEAIAGLEAHSGPAVGDLIKECRRINGLGVEALKEEVGNSDATRSESSSSGSPETSASSPPSS